MKHRLGIWGLFIGLWVLLLPVLAQAECPAIVETALAQIGDHCGDLSRNSACYGFDQIVSSFSQPQPDNFFSVPRDRADLVQLQTIQTLPLNIEEQQFGVAVLNAQANVPNSLPGQGVIFLLLGDATLNNGVAAENATELVQGIEVTTIGDTPLYTVASLSASIQEIVPAGTSLNADGTIVGGEWVRIIDDAEIVWVLRTALEANSAIDTLPDVGALGRTPMQAFYFTTGISTATCQEAESVIAIQSPENLTVNLSLNGVDIEMGSLITLTNSTLTVHRGHVRTSLGQVVNTNQTLEIVLDRSGNFIGMGALRDINEVEFSRGMRVQNAINQVAVANDWSEYDIVPVGTPLPTETPLSPVVSRPGCEAVHTVQRGDTLFRIGQRYNASLPAVVQANQISEPYIIFVGQELCIPDVDGGFIGLAGVNPPPDGSVPPDIAQTPEPSPVDCSGFQRVSGGENVISTFSWTPVPAADEYKINIYDTNGALTASRWYKAPTTAVDINMGEFATGGMFQWEVEALIRGQGVCNTGRSPMSPTPSRGGTPNCASATCTRHIQPISVAGLP